MGFLIRSLFEMSHTSPFENHGLIIEFAIDLCTILL